MCTIVYLLGFISKNNDKKKSFTNVLSNTELKKSEILKIIQEKGKIKTIKQKSK